MELSFRELLERQVQLAIDKCRREYPEIIEGFEKQAAEFLKQYPCRTQAESLEATITWSNLMTLHIANCSSAERQRGFENTMRELRKRS